MGAFRELLDSLKSAGQNDTSEGATVARWRDLYSTCNDEVVEYLKSCQSSIELINTGETIVCMTNKNWAMEHLICHIAEQLGTIDIWVATWSVSSDAVARFQQAKNRGFIRHSKWLVDERMKIWKPELFDLVVGTMGEKNVGRSKCHAKLYVIKEVNGDKNVSIVGSANFNKTPKQEAMVIMTDPRVAQFIIEWIEGQIK